MSLMGNISEAIIVTTDLAATLNVGVIFRYHT